MKSKYLDFVVVSTSLVKTAVFSVNSKMGGTLGLIKWYPAWRKYCFFPKEFTLFDQACLLDITKFIHKLMLERKITKKMLKEEKDF